MLIKKKSSHRYTQTKDVIKFNLISARIIVKLAN